MHHQADPPPLRHYYRRDPTSDRPAERAAEKVALAEAKRVAKANTAEILRAAKKEAARVLKQAGASKAKPKKAA